MTAKTVQVGLTFHHHYADGHPEWKVIRRVGDDCWACQIINCPDYSGTVQAFFSQQIIAAIESANRCVSRADENAEFLNKQKIGAIIHYHNGFGTYVRELVVEVNGKKMLKPIALVGNWAKHDLPSRRTRGEIYYPHNARRVVEGELTDHLEQSTTYEHPNFVKPGGDARNIDPHKLEPISLELPILDGDAKVAASLWRLLQSTVDILNLPRQPNEDVNDPQAPMSRLRKAFELMRPILDD